MAVVTKRDGWRFIIGAILEWQHLFGAVIRLNFWNRVWCCFWIVFWGCCLWIGGKCVLSIHNYFWKMTIIWQTSLLFKKHSRLTPKTNYTWKKLRVSAFQWYKDLGVTDRVFLRKQASAQNGWGCNFMEFFSPFLWLGNLLPIPTNFSMWMENGQNCYLLSRAVTCFVFSCDEMWFLLLSNELRLHMVHNFISK